MQKIAVFPGSFDPITNGHVDLIHRSTQLFDKVIIAIGVNAQKQSYFPLAMRLQWLQEIFAGNLKTEVVNYEGLTVDFCRRNNAQYIIRGLRNTADFEYEKTIAQINTTLEGGVETLFLMAAPENTHIHASVVRELIKYKGKFSHLVPACVTRDAS
jgi:pantetheine-phosphate adenylyltransferase